MAIEIIEPGLAASIQDQGRPGYYNVGIPPSGALDLFSAAAANVLVGNPSDAAVIESTYMGPKLRFTEDTVVAVTGADIPVKINGHTAPMWESFPVKTGDELSFGILDQGARMYVAVAGSFAVPEVLGSRSLYALGAFGGFEGRALQAGDLLPTGTAVGTPGRVLPRSSPSLVPAAANSCTTARAVWATSMTFGVSEWKHIESNRMDTCSPVSATTTFSMRARRERSAATSKGVGSGRRMMIGDPSDR